ncbi:MAG TPA: DUF4276 family protein [Sedimentisphaerales bacterium]|nr:DUF4276 family protein [Sedimentisphaerales bacterium]
MSARIYIEGGGDSKEHHVRCRQGFRQLLERCGFSGRMPRLVACGGRSAAYSDFKTAHESNKAEYVAMLIDSEEPVSDPEKTWDHLMTHDSWQKPEVASDEQVLFMTTCMETWIVTDRDTLRQHYGSSLQESVLPSLSALEQSNRQEVQEGLKRATRNCSNAYQKGKRSFEILGKLEPEALERRLLAFQRAKRILNEKLQ